MAIKAWVCVVTTEKLSADKPEINRPKTITILGPMRSTNAPNGAVQTIPNKAPQASSNPPKEVVKPRISWR